MRCGKRVGQYSHRDANRFFLIRAFCRKFLPTLPTAKLIVGINLNVLYTIASTDLARILCLRYSLLYVLLDRSNHWRPTERLASRGMVAAGRTHVCVGAPDLPRCRNTHRGLGRQTNRDASQKEVTLNQGALGRTMRSSRKRCVVRR